MITTLLLSALAGTFLMTVYSYFVSRMSGRQFREPALLGMMACKLGLISENLQFLTGALLHYLTGLGFTLAFYFLWQQSSLAPDLFFAITGGFCSGLLGILIWEVTFRLHPAPPKVEKPGFYLQLLPAHIIFGLGTTFTYLLIAPA